MRPTDLYPQHLIDELVRLYRVTPDWVTWRQVGEPDENGQRNQYQVKTAVSTWVRSTWKAGADGFGMWSASHWLGAGPKMFHPSKEQQRALEEVDVNLLLEEYIQPYPTLLVKVDYPPFSSVLCFHYQNILICTLNSPPLHRDDITTTVISTSSPIEASLRHFDADCAELGPTACKALRVACNSCLALTHYGCHLDYLLPKEVERDRRLGKEQSERGAKARGRLPLAVQVAAFDHEVKLHRTEGRCAPGEPTGREVATHWRRGHWAMAACGPQHSLRKRTFRRPTLVRADLFIGDPATTHTTYH